MCARGCYRANKYVVSVCSWIQRRNQSSLAHNSFLTWEFLPEHTRRGNKFHHIRKYTHRCMTQSHTSTCYMWWAMYILHGGGDTQFLSPLMNRFKVSSPRLNIVASGSKHLLLIRVSNFFGGLQFNSIWGRSWSSNTKSSWRWARPAWFHSSCMDDAWQHTLKTLNHTTEAITYTHTRTRKDLCSIDLKREDNLAKQLMSRPPLLNRSTSLHLAQTNGWLACP